MQNVSHKVCWLGTTIGRKQLIALTGLGLSLFVLVHMLGNMLIFVSPQKYNEYSHALVSNPMIYLAEAGLLAMFFGHMVLAIRMTRLNWQARDSRYAVSPSGDKAATFIQKSLWAQGLLILVFVILHLISFKFGTYYSVNYGGVEMRDIHRLVLEVFKNPLYVGWYCVALVVLAMHLSHGVGSSLQTLGFNHPRYNCMIKMASIGYALIVGVGFLSQPIYVYFFN